MTISKLDSILQEGMLELKRNNTSLALKKFQIILPNKHINPIVFALISQCYINLNNFKKAKEYILKAINKKPNEWGFKLNLINILITTKQYEEAEIVCKNAIDKYPEMPDLLYNLGVIYSKKRMYPDAIDFYKKALKVNSSNKVYYNNLGVALKETGDFKNAIKKFNKAINLDSSFTLAHFNLGIVLLLTKPDKVAWEKYEYRPEVNNDKKKFLDDKKITKWDGSSLENKTLIIYTEQGIGDSVMFIRYIKLINTRGTQIILYISKNLEYLFQQIGESYKIIYDMKDIPNADYYISLMSLPYMFRFNNKVPNHFNYFNISNKNNEYWKYKINRYHTYKVGLVWQGSKLYINDHKRSIALPILEPLLKTKGVKFFSLQKGMEGKPILKNNYQDFIIDFFDNKNTDKKPFSDTLAIINNLDLIISVDTLIAQISAIMNKETWVLLPYVSDFKWGAKGSKTHWYNNVKLIRQKKINNWDNVVLEVKQMLGRKVNKINFS